MSEEEIAVGENSVTYYDYVGSLLEKFASSIESYVMKYIQFKMLASEINIILEGRLELIDLENILHGPKYNTSIRVCGKRLNKDQAFKIVEHYTTDLDEFYPGTARVVKSEIEKVGYLSNDYSDRSDSIVKPGGVLNRWECLRGENRLNILNGFVDMILTAPDIEFAVLQVDFHTRNGRMEGRYDKDYFERDPKDITKYRIVPNMLLWGFRYDPKTRTIHVLNGQEALKAVEGYSSEYSADELEAVGQYAPLVYLETEKGSEDNKEFQEYYVSHASTTWDESKCMNCINLNQEFCELCGRGVFYREGTPKIWADFYEKNQPHIDHE